MSIRTVTAFQGLPGAYSDLACRAVFPGGETLPCPSFEDAFAAVREGQAARAMIPVENSVAGRVADIHTLLPRGGLHIVGEHYQRVNHHLLALPGTRLEEVKTVISHVQALSQCRETLKSLGLSPRLHADTAEAAAEVAARQDPALAAIASELAGQIYGLASLRRDMEDAPHNTTRFLIMAPKAKVPSPGSVPCVTTLVFRVRSVPAALYKALGGFATNGVNLTKLESYLEDGHFTAARFYAEVEGHPKDHLVRLALEELDFFARDVHILGVYPAHPFRQEAGRS